MVTHIVTIATPPSVCGLLTLSYPKNGFGNLRLTHSLGFAE